VAFIESIAQSNRGKPGNGSQDPSMAASDGIESSAAKGVDRSGMRPRGTKPEAPPAASQRTDPIRKTRVGQGISQMSIRREMM
jgi:hypothetical protein